MDKKKTCSQNDSNTPIQPILAKRITLVPDYNHKRQMRISKNIFPLKYTKIVAKTSIVLTWTEKRKTSFFQKMLPSKKLSHFI